MRANTPLNDKNNRHGLWENYFYHGDVMFKGYYVNNVELGYWIYNLAETDATLYYAR
jgi:hypothetical protein